MNNKKSAKDIAFDKERAKFRSEIRNLTTCLNDKQVQIDGLNETIREKDNIIRQQKEWIERLLEYTEMEKEDLQNHIETEKQKAEVLEGFSATLGIMGMFGKKWGFIS